MSYGELCSLTPSPFNGGYYTAKPNQSNSEKRPMKAIVYEKYGSPDMLQLKEVANPVPTDDELLIKVHTISVNRSEGDRADR
jgi:hypothetical protein